MDISLCGLCVCALYMCGGGVAIVVKKMTLIIYILKNIILLSWWLVAWRETTMRMRILGKIVWTSQGHYILTTGYFYII